MQGYRGSDGAVLRGSDGDSAIELNPIEKLAIAQAFQNKVGKMTKTGVIDNLRGQADSMYRKLYDQTGAKSFEVKVFGQKVGTYSITTTKDEPARTDVSLEVADSAALLEWALQYGFVNVDMRRVQEHFEACGEVPDGCAVVEIDVPAKQGGEFGKSTLRIDSEKVLDAIQIALPETTEMLLSDGDE